MSDFQNEYKKLRENAVGFYEQKRGLIEVSGKEAVQFLNGLITNDVAKLENGKMMYAAFPNAQGRLLAVVRVMRMEEKFLFETEEATHEKVYKNLFRFTYAGDFYVEDLSDKYDFVTVFNSNAENTNSEIIRFQSKSSVDYFVPKEEFASFKTELQKADAVEISDELYEVLRIENGTPIYSIDMDETTIVPEIDLPELVSYNKGCYIGQEIIARIHFRGHVAKKLTGLIFDGENVSANRGDELKSIDGKSAGKITSVAFSPKLGKTIALAYVRYEFLPEETELKVGDFAAKVKNLPFVD
jgi:folate-binding protein YgfZ